MLAELRSWSRSYYKPRDITALPSWIGDLRPLEPSILNAFFDNQGKQAHISCSTTIHASKSGVYVAIIGPVKE